MWMSQVDANGHYSLFITPLHYYQTYIGCVISVLTNGTLVYIILSRPHQKMGNYKYVVLAFVCFDISYSLVDVLTKPVSNAKNCLRMLSDLDHGHVIKAEIE